MDNSKLNDLILEYLNSKNYFGSLMLTAEWGTGKSYYLQNELIPFLKLSNKKAIVISLHGLKSPFEISKAVYLEYLISKSNGIKNKIQAHKKKLRALSVAAKTIVKGVANYFNIDLTCSEKDLKALYESIDFKDTLLVFEDVERSDMDPVDVLAYINNLVEYDHVKVLLIAFEDEIIKNTKDGKSRYLTIKEKTVSDTFVLYSDYVCAITNILSRYDKGFFADFLKSENNKDEISKIVVSQILSEKGIKSVNLRSIIYGCEKINSLLSQYGNSLNVDFLKNVVISMLIFCHKRKKNESLLWDAQENDGTSSKLGTYTYPLYKFCYNFIFSNYADKEEISKTEKGFIDFVEKQKIRNNLSQTLSVIFYCYLKTEDEVKNAIKQVKIALANDDIPYDTYFKLANYLIFIKHTIKCDALINNCLSVMEKNITKLDENEFNKIHFYGGIALESTEAINEFNGFKNRIYTVIKKNDLNPLDYDYSLENLNSFCEGAIKSKDKYINERSFASRLNTEKIHNLLKKCSAEQIDRLRNVFLTIYSFSNIKDFFINDKDNILKLLDVVRELKTYDKYDGFQKKQMIFFENNLNEIKEKLEY